MKKLNWILIVSDKLDEKLSFINVVPTQKGRLLDAKRALHNTGICWDVKHKFARRAGHQDIGIAKSRNSGSKGDMDLTRCLVKHPVPQLVQIIVGKIGSRRYVRNDIKLVTKVRIRSSSGRHQAK